MDSIGRYLAALQGPFELPSSLPEISALPKSGPTVLLFSPHPDDECITGALPLRFRREIGARIVNVAVTLGSNRERRAARAQELQAACALLDFELETLGWTGVTIEARKRQQDCWQSWVEQLLDLFRAYRPDAVFFPHADDAHPAHVGVFSLVVDALEKIPLESKPWQFLTEFWHPQSFPNVMVETSPENLALLLAALACHQGEISRNPYHRRLPAWMIDNTRRGAERIGSFGSAAPDFAFATLYQRRGPSGIAAPPALMPATSQVTFS